MCACVCDYLCYRHPFSIICTSFTYIISIHMCITHPVLLYLMHPYTHVSGLEFGSRPTGPSKPIPLILDAEGRVVDSAGKTVQPIIRQPTIKVCTLLYKDTSELRTLYLVPSASFVYSTTPEMRTPHYSGHFNLSQWFAFGTVLFMEVSSIQRCPYRGAPLYMYIISTGKHSCSTEGNLLRGSRNK